MSIEQYAGLIVSAITIVVAFAGSVRWLVKHYLYELKTKWFFFAQRPSNKA
jgi:hypothetical protein